MGMTTTQTTRPVTVAVYSDKVRVPFTQVTLPAGSTVLAGRVRRDGTVHIYGPGLTEAWVPFTAIDVNDIECPA